MADFIKNKTLYVLDENLGYVPLYTVNNEILLTADIIKGLFSYDDYYRAVCSPLSRRISRITLLNNDETVKMDVTEYLTACTVDLTHSQGKTRSASVTFLNTDGCWTPSPVKGFIWKGSKFRIEAGLYFNNTVFWANYGIFTPVNPVVDDSNQTVQFQLEDKFAFLDGTIGGTIDSDFKIPVGTPIDVAITSCLSSTKENGEKYDLKPIIFPNSKQNIVTPYTISKSPGLTYGEIIIELAEMISCNANYNENGNLVIEGNDDDIPLEDKVVLWNFDDSTVLHTQPNISMDMSKIINKVTVVGAIENGYRYKGVAINTNAQSRTNIYLTEPNAEYIEDSNIISDELCLARAKYELQKKTLLALQIKMSCVFIPNLVPNNLVTWTNKKHGFLNEKFFINSISLDILNTTLMDISLTNISEVMI